MQRWLLSTAAALAMASPTIAADLRAAAPPVKALPPPPVVYSWTGCYVDGGGGYGFSNSDSFRTNDNGVAVSSSVTNGGRGFFGTAGGGCDLQFGQRWVLGAFGNYDFADIKGDSAIPNTNLVGREKQDSAWAVGGRLGYTLSPSIMTYVNGGYTQARFDGFGLASQVNGTPANLQIGAHTYSGWFVGSGFEYNLGFMPGLFWRTEYRFSQYGRDTLPILDNGGGLTGLNVESEKSIQTIRSELVWRFNWGNRY
jgi:outer membrane immunogenic protein